MNKPLTLTVAQEERLLDIANGAPQPRGTIASQKALKAKGMIVFQHGAFRLTHYGTAVFKAIRERRFKSTSHNRQ